MVFQHTTFSIASQEMTGLRFMRSFPKLPILRAKRLTKKTCGKVLSFGRGFLAISFLIHLRNPTKVESKEGLLPASECRSLEVADSDETRSVTSFKRSVGCATGIRRPSIFRDARRLEMAAKIAEVAASLPP